MLGGSSDIDPDQQALIMKEDELKGSSLDLPINRTEINTRSTTTTFTSSFNTTTILESKKQLLKKQNKVITINEAGHEIVTFVNDESASSSDDDVTSDEKPSHAHNADILHSSSSLFSTTTFMKSTSSSSIVSSSTTLQSTSIETTKEDITTSVIKETPFEPSDAGPEQPAEKDIENLESVTEETDANINKDPFETEFEQSVEKDFNVVETSESIIEQIDEDSVKSIETEAFEKEAKVIATLEPVAEQTDEVVFEPQTPIESFETESEQSVEKAFNVVETSESITEQIDEDVVKPIETKEEAEVITTLELESAKTVEVVSSFETEIEQPVEEDTEAVESITIQIDEDVVKPANTKAEAALELISEPTDEVVESQTAIESFETEIRQSVEEGIDVVETSASIAEQIDEDVVKPIETEEEAEVITTLELESAETVEVVASFETEIAQTVEEDTEAVESITKQIDEDAVKPANTESEAALELISEPTDEVVESQTAIESFETEIRPSVEEGIDVVETSASIAEQIDEDVVKPIETEEEAEVITTLELESAETVEVVASFETEIEQTVEEDTEAVESITKQIDEDVVKPANNESEAALELISEPADEVVESQTAIESFETEIRQSVEEGMEVVETSESIIEQIDEDIVKSIETEAFEKEAEVIATPESVTEQTDDVVFEPQTPIEAFETESEQSVEKAFNVVETSESITEQIDEVVTESQTPVEPFETEYEQSVEKDSDVVQSESITEQIDEDVVKPIETVEEAEVITTLELESAETVEVVASFETEIEQTVEEDTEVVESISKQIDEDMCKPANTEAEASLELISEPTDEVVESQTAIESFETEIRQSVEEGIEVVETSDSIAEQIDEDIVKSIEVAAFEKEAEVIPTLELVAEQTDEVVVESQTPIESFETEPEQSVEKDSDVVETSESIAEQIDGDVVKPIEVEAFEKEAEVTTALELVSEPTDEVIVESQTPSESTESEPLQTVERDSGAVENVEPVTEQPEIVESQTHMESSETETAQSAEKDVDLAEILESQTPVESLEAETEKSVDKDIGVAETPEYVAEQNELEDKENIAAENHIEPIESETGHPIERDLDVAEASALVTQQTDEVVAESERTVGTETEKCVDEVAEISESINEQTDEVVIGSQPLIQSIETEIEQSVEIYIEENAVNEETPIESESIIEATECGQSIENFVVADFVETETPIASIETAESVNEQTDEVVIESQPLIQSIETEIEQSVEIDIVENAVNEETPIESESIIEATECGQSIDFVVADFVETETPIASIETAESVNEQTDEVVIESQPPIQSIETEIEQSVEIDIVENAVNEETPIESESIIEVTKCGQSIENFVVADFVETETPIASIETAESVNEQTDEVVIESQQPIQSIETETEQSVEIYIEENAVNERTPFESESIIEATKCGQSIENFVVADFVETETPIASIETAESVNEQTEEEALIESIETETDKPVKGDIEMIETAESLEANIEAETEQSADWAIEVSEDVVLVEPVVEVGNPIDITETRESIEPETPVESLETEQEQSGDGEEEVLEIPGPSSTEHIDEEVGIGSSVSVEGNIAENGTIKPITTSESVEQNSVERETPIEVPETSDTNIQAETVVAPIEPPETETEHPFEMDIEVSENDPVEADAQAETPTDPFGIFYDISESVNEKIDIELIETGTEQPVEVLLVADSVEPAVESETPVESIEAAESVNDQTEAVVEKEIPIESPETESSHLAEEDVEDAGHYESAEAKIEEEAGQSSERDIDSSEDTDSIGLVMEVGAPINSAETSESSEPENVVGSLETEQEKSGDEEVETTEPYSTEEIVSGSSDPVGPKINDKTTIEPIETSDPFAEQTEAVNEISENAESFESAVEAEAPIESIEISESVNEQTGGFIETVIPVESFETEIEHPIAALLAADPTVEAEIPIKSIETSESETEHPAEGEEIETPDSVESDIEADQSTARDVEFPEDDDSAESVLEVGTYTETSESHEPENLVRSLEKEHEQSGDGEEEVVKTPESCSTDLTDEVVIENSDSNIKGKNLVPIDSSESVSEETAALEREAIETPESVEADIEAEQSTEGDIEILEDDDSVDSVMAVGTPIDHTGTSGSCEIENPVKFLETEQERSGEGEEEDMETPELRTTELINEVVIENPDSNIEEKNIVPIDASDSVSEQTALENEAIEMNETSDSVEPNIHAETAVAPIESLETETEHPFEKDIAASENSGPVESDVGAEIPTGSIEISERGNLLNDEVIETEVIIQTETELPVEGEETATPESIEPNIEAEQPTWIDIDILEGDHSVESVGTPIDYTETSESYEPENPVESPKTEQERSGDGKEEVLETPEPCSTDLIDEVVIENSGPNIEETNIVPIDTSESVSEQTTALEMEISIEVTETSDSGEPNIHAETAAAPIESLETETEQQLHELVESDIEAEQSTEMDIEVSKGDDSVKPIVGMGTLLETSESSELENPAYSLETRQEEGNVEAVKTSRLSAAESIDEQVIESSESVDEVVEKETLIESLEAYPEQSVEALAGISELSSGHIDEEVVIEASGQTDVVIEREPPIEFLEIKTIPVEKDMVVAENADSEGPVSETAESIGEQAGEVCGRGTPIPSLGTETEQSVEKDVDSEVVEISDSVEAIFENEISSDSFEPENPVETSGTGAEQTVEKDIEVGGFEAETPFESIVSDLEPLEVYSEQTDDPEADISESPTKHSDEDIEREISTEFLEAEPEQSVEISADTFEPENPVETSGTGTEQTVEKDIEVGIFEAETPIESIVSDLEPLEVYSEQTDDPEAETSESPTKHSDEDVEREISTEFLEAEPEQSVKANPSEFSTNQLEDGTSESADEKPGVENDFLILFAETMAKQAVEAEANTSDNLAEPTGIAIDQGDEQMIAENSSEQIARLQLEETTSSFSQEIVTSTITSTKESSTGNPIEVSESTESLIESEPIEVPETANDPESDQSVEENSAAIGDYELETEKSTELAEQIEGSVDLAVISIGPDDNLESETHIGQPIKQDLETVENTPIEAAEQSDELIGVEAPSDYVRPKVETSELPAEQTGQPIEPDIIVTLDKPLEKVLDLEPVAEHVDDEVLNDTPESLLELNNAALISEGISDETGVVYVEVHKAPEAANEKTEESELAVETESSASESVEEIIETSESPAITEGSAITSTESLIQASDVPLQTGPDGDINESEDSDFEEQTEEIAIVELETAESFPDESSHLAVTDQPVEIADKEKLAKESLEQLSNLSAEELECRDLHAEPSATAEVGELNEEIDTAGILEPISESKSQETFTNTATEVTKTTTIGWISGFFGSKSKSETPPETKSTVSDIDNLTEIKAELEEFESDLVKNSESQRNAEFDGQPDEISVETVAENLVLERGNEQVEAEVISHREGEDVEIKQNESSDAGSSAGSILITEKEEKLPTESLVTKEEPRKTGWFSGFFRGKSEITSDISSSREVLTEGTLESADSHISGNESAKVGSLEYPVEKKSEESEVGAKLMEEPVDESVTPVEIEFEKVVTQLDERIGDTEIPARRESDKIYEGETKYLEELLTGEPADDIENTHIRDSFNLDSDVGIRDSVKEADGLTVEPQTPFEEVQQSAANVVDVIVDPSGLAIQHGYTQEQRVFRESSSEQFSSHRVETTTLISEEHVSSTKTSTEESKSDAVGWISGFFGSKSKSRTLTEAKSSVSDIQNLTEQPDITEVEQFIELSQSATQSVAFQLSNSHKEEASEQTEELDSGTPARDIETEPEKNLDLENAESAIVQAEEDIIETSKSVEQFGDVIESKTPAEYIDTLTETQLILPVIEISEQPKTIENKKVAQPIEQPQSAIIKDVFDLSSNKDTERVVEQTEKLTDHQNTDIAEASESYEQIEELAVDSESPTEVIETETAGDAGKGIDIIESPGPTHEPEEEQEFSENTSESLSSHYVRSTTFISEEYFTNTTTTIEEIKSSRYQSTIQVSEIPNLVIEEGLPIHLPNKEIADTQLVGESAVACESVQRTDEIPIVLESEQVEEAIVEYNRENTIVEESVDSPSEEDEFPERQESNSEEKAVEVDVAAVTGSTQEIDESSEQAQEIVVESESSVCTLKTETIEPDTSELVEQTDEVAIESELPFEGVEHSAEKVMMTPGLSADGKEDTSSVQISRHDVKTSTFISEKFVTSTTTTTVGTKNSTGWISGFSGSNHQKEILMETTWTTRDLTEQPIEVPEKDVLGHNSNGDLEISVEPIEELVVDSEISAEVREAEPGLAAALVKTPESIADQAEVVAIETSESGGAEIPVSVSLEHSGEAVPSGASAEPFDQEIADRSDDAGESSEFVKQREVVEQETPCKEFQQVAENDADIIESSGLPIEQADEQEEVRGATEIVSEQIADHKLPENTISISQGFNTSTEPTIEETEKSDPVLGNLEPQASIEIAPEVDSPVDDDGTGLLANDKESSSDPKEFEKYSAEKEFTFEDQKYQNSDVDEEAKAQAALAITVDTPQLIGSTSPLSENQIAEADVTLATELVEAVVEQSTLTSEPIGKVVTSTESTVEHIWSVEADAQPISDTSKEVEETATLAENVPKTPAVITKTVDAKEPVVASDPPITKELSNIEGTIVEDSSKVDKKEKNCESVSTHKAVEDTRKSGWFSGLFKSKKHNKDEHEPVVFNIIDKEEAITEEVGSEPPISSSTSNREVIPASSEPIATLNTRDREDVLIQEADKHEQPFGLVPALSNSHSDETNQASHVTSKSSKRQSLITKRIVKRIIRRAEDGTETVEEIPLDDEELKARGIGTDLLSSNNAVTKRIIRRIITQSSDDSIKPTASETYQNIPAQNGSQFSRRNSLKKITIRTSDGNETVKSVPVTKEDLSAKEFEDGTGKTTTRITKRIIRRTTRTTDGGEPKVTESIEEIPFDGEIDPPSSSVVTKRIIRRIVRSSNGIDKQISETITEIAADGTETTTVIPPSQSSNLNKLVKKKKAELKKSVGEPSSSRKGKSFDIPRSNSSSSPSTKNKADRRSLDFGFKKFTKKDKVSIDQSPSKSHSSFSSFRKSLDIRKDPTRNKKSNSSSSEKRKSLDFFTRKFTKQSSSLSSETNSEETEFRGRSSVELFNRPTSSEKGKERWK